MIYSRHQRDQSPGRGTRLIPNTVALVAGGPHPEQAGVLVDFLHSETTERLLAESVSGNLPLGPGLAESFPALALPDPVDVDFSAAAAARASAVDTAMRHLGAGAEDDAR